MFQDGKAYSIVTDHLGAPVETYNEQGEEVWYRRLDMNGKVIEERSMLYTSNKDYIKFPFLFQGQYYDEEIKLSYTTTHLGGGTIQISKGRTGTFTIDTNGASGRELGGKGTIHDANFHVLKYN